MAEYAFFHCKMYLQTLYFSKLRKAYYFKRKSARVMKKLLVKLQFLLE